MNKVQMGKNKSFVSSDNTKFILNQSCPFIWCVCECARHCIIKRSKFVIKILCVVRILV